MMLIGSAHPSVRPASDGLAKTACRVGNATLELAVALGAPRGDSTDEAIVTAERLLAWLKKEE
jgi:hypothetical protein